MAISRGWLHGLAQGQCLWLRAAPGFPGIYKKNGKMDLLVIEVGWAVGLHSWFLCNSLRQFKG